MDHTSIFGRFEKVAETGTDSRGRKDVSAVGQRASQIDMTDAFVLLDEPRRPWLDAEALKQKFLPLSGASHPDRIHSAPEAEKQAATSHYAELNAAYNTLREPRDR